MKTPHAITTAILLVGLTLSAAAQSSSTAPAGLPPERFEQLQKGSAESNATTQIRPPTAFGIAPDKFQDLQDALQEAYLSEGEIAEITDRIEALLAARDRLVVAAALAAHPELKEEIGIFQKGQADQRVKGKAALGQRRRDLASGAVPRPGRHKGKN